MIFFEPVDTDWYLKITMKKIILYLIGSVLNALAYVAPRTAGRLGFNLFCHPFRTALQRKHHTFLDTAEAVAIDHEGIRIQTYQWGNGKKHILLLHGWQSHTYRWKKYVDHFDQASYTIHAFDAPGHGRSGGNYLHIPLYSKVISQVVRHIGGVDCIIGHSIGSFATLHALYTEPDLLVESVVTLACPGEATEFLSFYTRSIGLNKRSGTLIGDHFVALFKRSPKEFSAPLFAAHLQIPGLIVHDADDRDTSIVHGERLHQAWEQSTMIRTTGLGHDLKSQDIVDAVGHFVRRAGQLASH